MKRFGYLLLPGCTLLLIHAMSWAQPESRHAQDLLRVLTGKDVRGYFGSARPAPDTSFCTTAH